MTDNDEERVIVEVPAHEVEEEPTPIARRILIWAAVVAVGLLLLSVLLDRPVYDLKTVPDALAGKYTCDLPEYSDRYLVLRPSSITFSTGGTSFIKYAILGADREEVEGVEFLILHFRDVAGTEFSRRIMVDPSGSRFHFTSQPRVVWKHSEP